MYGFVKPACLALKGRQMGEIFLVPSARSGGSKHPKTQNLKIEDR
jgi:hypothetical protein